MTSWITRSALSFFYGISIPWLALKTILKSPLLILLSILPAVLTFFIYGYFSIQIESWAKSLLVGFLTSHGISSSQGWIWAFDALIWILLMIFSIRTFSLIAGVIALPLNDFLAEKAEPLSTPSLKAVPELTWRIRLRILRIDLIKTLFAAAMGMVCLLISWIPLINIIAFALSLALMTFQFLSYPQTRRGESIFQGIGLIIQKPFCSLGFGAIFSLLFAIPGVSSVALPLAVVGGTLLYSRATSDSELG